MRVSTILMAATTAIFGLSTASWSDEPDDYFDSVTAKLYGAGYSQVLWVDRDHQLLSAHDGVGNEVLIVVGTTSGDILTISKELAANQ